MKYIFYYFILLPFMLLSYDIYLLLHFLWNGKVLRMEDFSFVCEDYGYYVIPIYGINLLESINLLYYDNDNKYSFDLF